MCSPLLLYIMINFDFYFLIGWKFAKKKIINWCEHYLRQHCNLNYLLWTTLDCSIISFSEHQILVCKLFYVNSRTWSYPKSKKLREILKSIEFFMKSSYQIRHHLPPADFERFCFCARFFLCLRHLRLDHVATIYVLLAEFSQSIAELRSRRPLIHRDIGRETSSHCGSVQKLVQFWVPSKGNFTRISPIKRNSDRKVWFANR